MAWDDETRGFGMPMSAAAYRMGGAPLGYGVPAPVVAPMSAITPGSLSAFSSMDPSSFLDDVGMWNGSAPGANQGGLFAGMTTFDKGRMALGGLQTLGNLWSSWQAAKLAKKSFRFQKEFANRNLENQTKTYNTALDDRVANRQAVYAGSENAMTPEMARKYLDENRLSTARVRG